MCDVVTSGGNCLTYTTTKLPFDDQQSFCYNSYGSNLVMIDSSQFYDDVGDFCSNYIDDQCWIGIKLNSCNNSNFTLHYVNGASITDYSFIKWCHGYPNIDLCVSFVESSIYLDATNSSYCLKNGFNLELNGICGNPVNCFTGDAQRGYGYDYIFTVCGLLGTIFTSIALRKFYQHLCKMDHNWIIAPFKATICTGICLPVVQLIQYVLWML